MLQLLSAGAASVGPSKTTLCLAFDAIRLVTKVLVSDLVHIGFWQKKGAINISMTEAKRANAKICLTNCLTCKYKQALHEKYCPGLTYDGISFDDKAENGIRYINRLKYTLSQKPKDI